MDRRNFLTGVASSTLVSFSGARADINECGLDISLAQTGPSEPISQDFVGLSYESAVVAAADYFTPANQSVIGLIRGLNNAGVIRIGGNTSERTVWRPEGSQAIAGSFVVTPAAIDAFATTIRLLGWRAIYGLNLARGTADQAAEEAAYVAQALGAQLIAFQISNEPDGFGSWSGVRPSSFDFAQFYREWLPFHTAIRARLPEAAFAGPDVAAETGWVGAFAKAAPAGLTLLTRHYYADGPATAPHVTLAKLLSSAPQAAPILAELGRYSREFRLPFRIAETNSVFAGGRPGVSDTFGAALWGLELMFQSAAAGAAGINFHGGDDKVYSPIARVAPGLYRAQPLYFALLMFAHTGRGAVSPAPLVPSQNGLSAFVAQANRRLSIVVINKNGVQGACVRIRPLDGYRAGHILRLSAPALDSAAGVTLAGGGVDAFGRWAAQEEPVNIVGSSLPIDVPAASAAAVILE